MHIEFPLSLDIVHCAGDVTTALGKTLSTERDKFVVVTGKNFSRNYYQTLFKDSKLPIAHIIEVHENSVKTIYEAERSIYRSGISWVIAIGGGRVCDFAKRLAYISGLKLLLVPTIIANDGLISPIAVVRDDGRSVSLAGKMPDYVIIDLSTVRQTPDRYLIAAACDLITNLSATNDWQKSLSGADGREHHLAFQLSRMAAFGVLDCRSWDLRADAFLRALVSGQVLSGVAMALAGTSRPCSGSEHLISHALDHLEIGTHVLHGEKVGIASRFCLHLQGQNSKLIEDFFHAFNVSRIFPGCEISGHGEITRLFSVARDMRPGRATILDQYSDEELTHQYFNFVDSGGQ